MERILSYTEVRQQLKSVLDSVVEDRIAVVIRRKSGDPVIMMAKSEHDAMMETFHLLRSPRNAERLQAAIAEVEAGDVVTANLRAGEIEEAP